MQKYFFLFEVQNIFRIFAHMNENMQVKKPRLEWLDALRGFTMVMVVAYHVTQGFGETWKTSETMPFLALYRMPLFFFVSGFLAYKASQVWSLRNLGSLVVKKLRVQLIPTIVFFLFAMAVLNPDFWKAVSNALVSQYKGGYWFTIALLYMFLIYYPFAYLENKLTSRLSPKASKWFGWMPIALLFLVSLFFYESCYLPRHFYWAFGYKKAHPMWLWESSFIQVLQYFPFFLYGNIVHRYWDKAQQIMDSRWFYPVMMLVLVFAAFDALKWHTLRMEWANLPLSVSKFLLLTMVLMYFRHFKEYFTKFTVWGTCLQYIGRRTLDIYLIHFLFLPHLPEVGEFFQTHPHSFIIDVTLAIFLGMLIIGFCIITSNILRVSPFLKKWLFGRS